MKGIANKDCSKSLLIAEEGVVEDIILVVDDVRVELRETVCCGLQIYYLLSTGGFTFTLHASSASPFFAFFPFFCKQETGSNRVANQLQDLMGFLFNCGYKITFGLVQHELGACTEW